MYDEDSTMFSVCKTIIRRRSNSSRKKKIHLSFNYAEKSVLLGFVKFCATRVSLTIQTCYLNAYTSSNQKNAAGELGN